MTRSVDPFEEFLRKKKVEMLEQQIRKDGRAPSAEPAGAETFDDDWSPRQDDESPERSERLNEEMNQLFTEGASDGAELFERAANIDEERVDKIKDALEDVFVESSDETQVDEGAEDTFKDFFKEVQTNFVPEAAEPAPEAEIAHEIAHEVAMDAETGEFEEEEPLTAEFPPPDEVGALPAAEGTPLEIEPEPLAIVPEVAEAADLAEASVAALSEYEDADDVLEQPLSVAEMLQPVLASGDQAQRIEVLTRLVIKLVERANLPENEVVEVLIKSGVSF